MKSLIFLDLMGTLLEARHVACRSENYDRKSEYLSRILYVSRKLNTLAKNNIVVINTSVDHCELNDLFLILCDIDKYIDNDLKDSLHYYISCGENGEYNLASQLYTAYGKSITLVETKKEIYSEMLDKYYNLLPVAVDDNILYGENDGLNMVYRKNGKLCIIHNPLTSVVVYGEREKDYQSRYYPYADNETILKQYIDSYTEANNFNSRQKEQFINDIYQDYMEGNIDIKSISFYGIMEGTKRYFSKHGLDKEEIQESITNRQISFVSSFEEAYQKILKPLI